MKIDEYGRYLFVGSSNGLIQSYNLHNFTPAAEPLTISSFSITSICTYCPDMQEPLNLVITLSSGQVLLYKQISSDFSVTQNFMGVEEYTIQRNNASFRGQNQLSFEFLSQIQNHFDTNPQYLHQMARVAKFRGPPEGDELRVQDNKAAKSIL